MYILKGIKTSLESGSLTHACNPNLKKLNQEEYYEFKASLLSST